MHEGSRVRGDGIDRAAEAVEGEPATELGQLAVEALDGRVIAAIPAAAVSSRSRPTRRRMRIAQAFPRSLEC